MFYRYSTPVRSAIIKKVLGSIYVFGLIACMIMLVAFPDKYVSTAAEGLKVWAITVAPSLLPFFFLTALLTKTDGVQTFARKTERLGDILYGSGGLSIFLQLTSFLSGYPIGAKTISELKKSGTITSLQAEKLSIVSSTSGPLFIVGGIGVSLFGDKTAGALILISHLLSSVAVGIIFKRFLKSSVALPVVTEKTQNVLYESIYSSVISVAIVGGFIAVFYTLANVFYDLGLLYPITAVLKGVFGEKIAKGVAIGLIECTTGIKAIAATGTTMQTVALSCALVSFGGVSVWCQSIIYLGQAGARIRIFALSKVLHSIISYAICILLYVVFY